MAVVFFFLKVFKCTFQSEKAQRQTACLPANAQVVALWLKHSAWLIIQGTWVRFPAVSTSWVLVLLAVWHDAFEEVAVDLAVEEGDADARDSVVEAEHDGKEDGSDDLEKRPVEVGRVAVVGGLEGLLDLVAVLHVLLGQAEHILGGQGLLDQEGVELVHLVLHLVEAGAGKNVSQYKISSISVAPKICFYMWVQQFYALLLMHYTSTKTYCGNSALLAALCFTKRENSEK